MKSKTKIKISSSLKKYHKKRITIKQQNTEVKNIVWIISIIILIGVINTHKLDIIKFSEAKSPTDRHSFLPKNKDRIFETVEEQIISIAQEHNFKWIDYLIRLARCENDTFDPNRINDKGNTPTYSIDRGIFMINDYWHKEVSDECAYNVRCSTEWTIQMINNGRQSEWVCDGLI